MRQLDPEYRLEKNIKIAMLYLEDDDAVSAETFIKKASTLIGSCKVPPPPPCSAVQQCAPEVHYRLDAAVCRKA